MSMEIADCSTTCGAISRSNLSINNPTNQKGPFWPTSVHDGMATEPLPARDVTGGGCTDPNEPVFSTKMSAPCSGFGTWECNKPHPSTSSRTSTFNARRIDGSVSCSTPLADNSALLAHTGRGLERVSAQDDLDLHAMDPQNPSPSP
jgi:hypothetical protein